MPNFAGISDPYEPPRDSELMLNTAGISAEQAVMRILQDLREREVIFRMHKMDPHHQNIDARASERERPK